MAVRWDARASLTVGVGRLHLKTSWLERFRSRRARLGHELNLEGSPLGRLLGTRLGCLILEVSPFGTLAKLEASPAWA